MGMDLHWSKYYLFSSSLTKRDLKRPSLPSSKQVLTLHKKGISQQWVHHTKKTKTHTLQGPWNWDSLHPCDFRHKDFHAESLIQVLHCDFVSSQSWFQNHVAFQLDQTILHLHSQSCWYHWNSHELLPGCSSSVVDQDCGIFKHIQWTTCIPQQQQQCNHKSIQPNRTILSSNALALLLSVVFFEYSWYAHWTFNK